MDGKEYIAGANPRFGKGASSQGLGDESLSGGPGTKPRKEVWRLCPPEVDDLLLLIGLL